MRSIFCMDIIWGQYFVWILHGVNILYGYYMGSIFCMDTIGQYFVWILHGVNILYGYYRSIFCMDSTWGQYFVWILYMNTIFKYFCMFILYGYFFYKKNCMILCVDTLYECFVSMLCRKVCIFSQQKQNIFHLYA